MKIKLEIELPEYGGNKEDIANIVLFGLRGINSSKKVSYMDANYLLFKTWKSVSAESCVDDKKCSISCKGGK